MTFKFDNIYSVYHMHVWEALSITYGTASSDDIVFLGMLTVKVLENASMEMESMKLRDSWGRKMQLLKRKYEYVRVKNVSMENTSTSPQRQTMQVRKI